MPNLRDRIAMEVGSYPTSLTNPELDQIITDSLAEVVAELPDSALYSIAETVTDSGSGVSVGDRRILRAHKSNYVAGKVDYVYATDTERTFVATKPIWYELGGTAYIKPSGGTFLMSKELTANHLTTAITGVNSFFNLLVIAKAALHVLRYKAVRAREAFASAITLPTAPTIPAAPDFTYTPATATTISTVTIGAFGTAPTYTAPTLSPSYTNFDTYFSLEDSEVGALALEKLAQQLRDFQGQMQNALNTFNEENVAYQASIQDAIEQARIDLQRLSDDAQRTDNIGLANEARVLEAQVSEYVQSLQRFSQELALYSSQVNAESARFSQSIERSTAEIRSLSYDIQRVQATYRERYLQYVKSYSQMPPIRPVQHDY